MLDIIVQVLVTGIAWVFLLGAASTFTGFAVRPVLEYRITDDFESVKGGTVKGFRRSSRFSIVLGCAALFSFCFGLYAIGNVGLLIAGVMVVVSRIPDLAWEVRSGRQLAMEDMRKPPFAIASTLLSWLSLPVVWYAIFMMGLWQ